MGAIFDVLSKAIAIYPAVRLPALPRMADFATWGYAITEAAGGKGEAFLRAYRKNIAGAVEEAVTNDIVGAAVAEFMDGKEEWEGTDVYKRQILALLLLGELWYVGIRAVAD